jgi:hypothetical protein
MGAKSTNNKLKIFGYKCKSKVVPVHAMTAYRESKRIDPLILKLGTKLRLLANFAHWSFYSLFRTPVPIVQEAEWDREFLRTNWRRDTFLVAVEIRTLIVSVQNLITQLQSLAVILTLDSSSNNCPRMRSEMKLQTSVSF